MEEKFIELLHQNQGIVHKITNLYFGARLEKEDYHQELIIQLWKAFPSFNKTAKFSTWMYRVCLNAAIDITRKEKKHFKHVRLSGTEGHDISDTNDGEYANQEKLYQAISRLSTIDKAIITLYLEEYSYKEIAEIAGITESNTGVKINRIKSEILKSFKNGNG